MKRFSPLYVWLGVSIYVPLLHWREYIGQPNALEKTSIIFQPYSLSHQHMFPLSLLTFGEILSRRKLVNVFSNIDTPWVFIQEEQRRTNNWSIMKLLVVILGLMLIRDPTRDHHHTLPTIWKIIFVFGFQLAIIRFT